MIRTFFKSEIAIGVVLMVATAFSLLIANSNSFEIYQEFFSINLPLSLDFIGIYKDLTLRDWVNDALMAIFFLLVGLELKKEVLIGELSSKKKILLPAIAACGGVLFPFLVFISFNYDNAQNIRGFAVPCATDIAFAYGMISLFGKKISNSLKVFLVALAILDDLVAIIFITLFYSKNIDFNYLVFASFVVLFLFFLKFKNCSQISIYLVTGIFLWLFILKSGVHPTLAGVLLALFIPLNVKNKPLLEKLAHQISPVVNFLILPLFAFANMGLRIEDFSLQNLYNPLILGIALGLFLGKQIGVMLFSFVAVKFNIVNLPRGTSWLEFYGAAIFTGIGFTMSLFIGSLAFSAGGALLDEVKIAVLIGSLLSIIYGILITFLATRSN